MVSRRIPVVILAGFLGSGKTTLLNHLLRNSRGTRIGAIVNDFGSIEIDAMTVAGQVDSMVSLGDGCLCCAVDTSDMDEVLEVLARPSAGMDVLVIEASGLAEPETLIRMILASESPHITYGGLVEVVDAAEFSGVRERHPELDRHVGAADLVVLNKADRVAPGRLETLRATLADLSPGTPLVPASYGRLDPELLFDRARRERAPVEQLSFDTLLYGDEGYDPEHGEHAESGDHSGHLHAAYESVGFTAEAAMEPRRFLSFLDSRPSGLYRIKGFVDFGAADPAHKYALHAVGGFLRFSPLPWGPGEERGTQVVMIGAGVRGDTLLEALGECVVRAGETLDERGIWGVLRYVENAEGSEEPEAGRGAEPEPEPEAGLEPELEQDPEVFSRVGEPGPARAGHSYE